MNRFLRLFTGSFIGLFALLFVSTTALAGGQLVSLTADTNGWVTDTGYGRVIRLYIGPGFPCKGTEIAFSFTDSKDGDYIMTGSGNATYTMQEDRSAAGCATYAKFMTKNSETRLVTVKLKNGDRVWEGNNAPTIKVDFDGKSYADNTYNGYNYRTSLEDPYAFTQNQPLPTPTLLPPPSGTLQVWMLNQQPVAPVGRSVQLKWSALQGTDTDSVFYYIFGRKAHEKEWHKLLGEQGGPSATITIKADEDNYIKVQGCLSKVGNCIDSNELFLPKIQKQNETVSPTPTATVSSVSNGNDKNIDVLQKKVNDLQNQLNE